MALHVVRQILDRVQVVLDVGGGVEGLGGHMIDHFIDEDSIAIKLCTSCAGNLGRKQYYVVFFVKCPRDAHSIYGMFGRGRTTYGIGFIYLLLNGIWGNWKFVVSFATRSLSESKSKKSKDLFLCVTVHYTQYTRKHIHTRSKKCAIGVSRWWSCSCLVSDVWFGYVCVFVVFAVGRREWALVYSAKRSLWI